MAATACAEQHCSPCGSCINRARQQGNWEGTWTELWLGILFLSSPAGISAYLLIIINNIYLCFLRTAEPEPNFKLFFLGTG